MCTVNIQVDEAVLRDVMPELNSMTAIRLWAQQLIDHRIKEIAEDAEMIDLETMREDLHRMVKEVYAQP